MANIVVGTMDDKCSGKVHLHFNSSRASTNPANLNSTEQLLVSLQECRGIIKPSDHKNWSKMFITPLRDRMMISWLFGSPVAKTEFRRLVSIVDKLLTDQDRDQDKQLHKLIVQCESGTQLSVAFVEKLYDYYNYESEHKNSLLVTRSHPDAFTGEWGRSKRFVWQRYYKANFGSPDQSMDSYISGSFHLWRVCSSDSVENAFQKDPFAKNVVLGDYVYDFESGYVSHKSGHRYRLRCTMIPDEDQFLSYKQLTVDSFKSATRSYNAAGILPCASEPSTGDTVCLVGEMTYETCTWSDFGGLRGRVRFWEDACQTAARECFEETLGVIGSCDELHSFATKDDVFKLYNVGTNYVAHFVPVPYQDYPMLFDEAAKGSNNHLEVCRLRWVRMASLRQAVRRACQQVSCSNIRVDTLPTGPNDKSKDCELRSELVSSLCIAEKLGFLSAMEGTRSHAEGASGGVDYNRSDSYKSAVEKETSICKLGRGGFKNIVF